MNMESIYINCDGASRGNPGRAAIGIQIKGEDKKTVLKQHSEYIGKATNNVAEYLAVLKSLDIAKKFTNQNVFVYSDSELLVRQMNGRYKVKNKNLKELFDQVQKLQKSFQKVVFTHVRREYNVIADQLANEALDGYK
ncbi:MAG: ribonuclease HI family protein [Candidatus Thermoplasmatota archaeon]|nr:ribonuclease HI family protein [Candidatus Thermoplasmatota archaeon]